MDGLNIRDMFAIVLAHAMCSQCEGPMHLTAKSDQIAEQAYIFADKLLAHRERDHEERAA